IGDICFGHPKSNSLPASVLRSLADEIRSIGSRSDVRVVVLRSYGTGAFCAGASFDELMAITDPAAGKEFFMGFARAILAMIRCPKPIIARVHGKVVGGGAGLVAASDYAIATGNASLRLSELAVGIGPFVVGPVIEHTIGAGAFTPMAIDADWRDAPWGERKGLYARVVDTADQLDDAVASLAKTLSASNPEALASIKEIAWRGTEHWPALLEERAAISGTLVLSEFTRNALRRFAQPSK
ncbi:MAG TPA: enoyl-CoA hydratase/isomerase family protein, partial [Gemmatimonadaceae bacterium]|nr:enoyl-CoA hydratase/isomerase family protein [Gemmatimonadaceae bacterium]